MKFVITDLKHEPKENPVDPVITTFKANIFNKEHHFAVCGNPDEQAVQRMCRDEAFNEIIAGLNDGKQQVELLRDYMDKVINDPDIKLPLIGRIPNDINDIPREYHEKLFHHVIEDILVGYIEAIDYVESVYNSARWND